MNGKDSTTKAGVPEGRRPLNVAGIDVGTNSLILTIARKHDDQLVVLEDKCVITRLGQGLGQQGELSQKAIDRTLKTLESFGQIIREHQTTARAAGTSALRRASDAKSFLERARQALGFELEVLSGQEEARLGYLGALSDLQGLDRNRPPVVVDPGGGSTEVFLDPENPVSLEIGAVRLTEEFLENDPPSDGELENLRKWAQKVVSDVKLPELRQIVALGGTATTLAALHLKLTEYDSKQVHGSELDLESIEKLAQNLAKLPLSEREKIPCLPPGRADVIVAGAILLAELLRGLGADRALISDRGLRFGLIQEIFES